MSTTAVPTVEDLSAIASQVWASYLDPEGIDPLVPAELPSSPTDVVASVSVSGGWSGHVVVSCSTTAARQTAAAFLMMDATEVSGEDVADVMGELANIVGGNVKSMLPSSSYVSLPHVVNGPDAGVRWPACQRVSELAGTWRGEPMSISVWHKDDKGRVAPS